MAAAVVKRYRRNGDGETAATGKSEATETAVARDMIGGDGNLVATLTAARRER